MRFSLQDVKKSIHRRGNELYVTLHFLRPNELHSEIERLVTYYEGLLHHPQRQFSIDDARACIGDYRLAHCLISTLSAWYSWQSPNWTEVLQQNVGTQWNPVGAGEDVVDGWGPLGHHGEALEAAGITSPIHLRLALFTYVNEHHHGFLDTNTRPHALEAFADLYHLSIPNLEYLLALDSDDEAILTRNTPHPPTPEQVATLYNQWAFEAALFNASNVHFLIDCNAFQNVSAQSVGAGEDVVEGRGPSGWREGRAWEALQGRMSGGKGRPGGASPATGVGAVIKRLCYLARKLGVYYDLAYDPAAPSTAPLLHLTLYGTQEVTGASQQYGLRLARLCRMLLGYGVSQPQSRKSTVGMHGGARLNAGGPKRGIPFDAIREAEATIHFLQRSYNFSMDTNLLNLLPSTSETNVGAQFIAPVQSIADSSKTTYGGAGNSLPTRNAQLTAPSSSYIFDSSIEQRFSEAFSALESSHGVEGWRLEREPEPLLVDRSIFIPDFALTRGDRRIYIEILGFWTSAYRERKIAKLQQLSERNNLLLAIPVEARSAFASIASSFPIVWYEDQLSATELLQVVRNSFDNFEERLAQIDVESVRMRILNEGLLPERACYELLHCYRRSELQQAAERIVGDDTLIAFTPGIGLYDVCWLERLRDSFVEWIRDIARENSEDSSIENGITSYHALPLADVLQGARERWPLLGQCEDAALEAIIDLWPEICIRRDSIFEPVVELVDQNEANIEQICSLEEESATKSANIPKKPSRERRTPPKKRIIHGTKQADLWG